MNAETNDFIVIENEGIAPPLLVNRATDADGRPWTDGKIHADKIFLPAKTDGVTDNDGNTLTQLLTRINASVADETLAREEADNEINRRIALIETVIAEGGNSGGSGFSGLSLQTTEAVIVIPLEMLSPDMPLFTLTGKGVLRSYRLNSDFLGRTYVRIDGRDMGNETGGCEYWFQEKAEIIFDGFLDGRGFGTLPPLAGAAELTVVYDISV